jgi:HlyD family secretion protein
MKSRLSPLLPAVLPALALAISSGCKPAGGGPLTFETTPATRGGIVQHVTASGALSAVVSVDVGSQISGRILKLFVDFNSVVTNGQIVAQIDPAIYVANVHQSEGNLANAKAALELARVNEERGKKLLADKLIPESDYDQAVASLHQAQASVEIFSATLANSQANLNYCTIYSPINGIVISRKLDVGQTVAAAMTTPVLFTIAQDITKMNISASISEADIGQVKTGQPVDFTVDAFPDEVFHGAVTQVRKAPTTTANVVTYETIIAVDNPEQKLFPGMTADVSILTADRTNALKIPNTALRFTPPLGAEFEQTPPFKLQRTQRLVYQLGADGKKLKPVIVKTGITDGVDTEILDGLADGAAVVTSTLTGLKMNFGGPPPPGQ